MELSNGSKKEIRQEKSSRITFFRKFERGESSKETFMTIFDYASSIFFTFGSPVVESFPIGVA